MSSVQPEVGGDEELNTESSLCLMDRQNIDIYTWTSLHMLTHMRDTHAHVWDKCVRSFSVPASRSLSL